MHSFCNILTLLNRKKKLKNLENILTQKKLTNNLKSAVQTKHRQIDLQEKSKDMCSIQMHERV